MADSLDQDIVRKALDGKTSTDDNLTAQEETLPSGVVPSPSKHLFGPLLGSQGDVRFFGDVDDYALFAQSVPATTPYRYRRLVQQTHVYGARVVAEGTTGVLNNSSTTFTSGVADMSYLASDFTLSDLRLVITNAAGVNESLANLYTDTYGIDAVAGANLTLDRAYTSALGSISNVYYQVVLPQPVRLLAWPGDDDTQSLVYMTRLPDEWPARASAVSMDSSSVVASLTSEGRLQLVASHNDPQTFNTGDWASLGGSFYYVQDVTFTPGAPNIETLVLDPFYGTELPTDLDDLPTTVEVVYTVGELANDPFAVRDEFLGNSIFEADDGVLLDTIRVRNLIAPSQVKERARVAASLALDVSLAGNTEPVPGYGMTLYPATAGGVPDLDNPITDLENITIDPSVTGPQQVFVDYTEGLIRLSTPIPAAGGDLNPNNYTDANGRPRLFAVFAAHNGRSLPEVSQGVEVYASDLGPNPAFKGQRKVSLDVGEQGLTVQLPSTEGDSIYHGQSSNEQLQIESGSTVANSQGATLEARSLGVDSRRLGRTALTMGLYNSQSARTLGITLRPKLDPSQDTDSQYEWRVTEGRKRAFSAYESTWPVVVGGANDVFEITANGVPFGYTQAAGPAPAAATLAASLEAAYTAAEGALGLSAQTFNVDAVTDATGTRLRFEATGDLFFGSGNAHAGFGIPVDTETTPYNIIQEVAFDGSIEREWGYDTASQEIESDVEDVRLSGGTSGRSVPYDASLRGASQVTNETYPKFVISGGVASLGTATRVDVTQAVVKHPNFTDLRGTVISTAPAAQFEFSGDPVGTYYIYFSYETYALAVIDSTDGAFDPLFETGAGAGVPLVQVDWDGVSITTEDLYDIRRYANKQLEANVITVGANGMFRTLKGAMAYVALRNTTITNPDGAFVVKLLENFTLTEPAGDVVYIPSNTVLDLGGHTLAVEQYTGGAGTGPFAFGQSDGLAAGSATSAFNVTIRNGTLSTDNFGTQAGGTAPDMFRNLGATASDKILFEDLTIQSTDDIETFVSALTLVEFRRVRMTSPDIKRLVEFSAAGSKLIVEDSVLFARNQTVGREPAIVLYGAGSSVQARNSFIAVEGEQPLVSCVDASTVGPALRFTQCDIVLSEDSGFVARTGASAKLFFSAEGTRFSYRNDQLIIDDFAGTALQYAEVSFSDCQIFDVRQDTSSFNFLPGLEAVLSFENTYAENVLVLSGGNGSQVNISNSRFVSEGLTGGGTSIHPELQMTSGTITMTGSEFAGRLLLTTCTTTMHGVTMLYSPTVAFADRLIQITGGSLVMGESTINFTALRPGNDGTALNVLTREIMLFEEGGVGLNTEPKVTLSNCDFTHNTNAAIRITGETESVIVTGCRFAHSTGIAAGTLYEGDYGIYTEDEVGATPRRLVVTGSLFRNYYVSGTDSGAIVVGDNNAVATLFSNTAINSGGSTNFTIGAGVTDLLPLAVDQDTYNNFA